MYAVVGFIPLLMHGSLLLFFAGLVAFLYAINPVIMIVVGLLLGLILAVYAYLTVLPIFFSDSPYRTPLSNMAWNMLQRMTALRFLGKQDLPDEETARASVEARIFDKEQTMIEVMRRDAAQESSERDERDARVIGWTVSSLADNGAIEPFVEALPELILGSNGTGSIRVYHNMLNMLLEDPGIRLIPRIESLLRSCNFGHLPPDTLLERRMSSIKALWAIAYFVASDAFRRSVLPVFDLGLLLVSQNNSPVLTSGPEIQALTPWGVAATPFVITATTTQKSSWTAVTAREATYVASAYSIARWIRLCSQLSFIQDVGNQLKTASASDVPALLEDAQRRAATLGFLKFNKLLSDAMLADPNAVPLMILQHSREQLILVENTDIFTEYVRAASRFGQKPRAFEIICSMIRHPELRVTEYSVQESLRETFISIAHENFNFLCSYPAQHHIDLIADMLLRLIVQSPAVDAEFTRAVAVYVASRGGAIPQVLARCDTKKLVSFLTKHLAPDEETNTSSDAVWALYLLAKDATSSSEGLFNESILAAISAAPHCPSSPAAIAVVKILVLSAAESLPLNQLESLMDRVQIPKFSSEAGAPFGPTERWKASFFAILVEFLEQSSLTSPPNNWATFITINTFRFLDARLRPDGVPGPLLERRFANRLLQILNSPPARDLSAKDIIMEIITWGEGSPAAKFNDPVARATIFEALSTYSLSLGSYEQPWVLESIHRFRAVNTRSAHVETSYADPKADATSDQAKRFILTRSESDSQSGSDTKKESDSHQSADGGPQVLDQDMLLRGSHTDGEGDSPHSADPDLQVSDQRTLEQESDTGSESDSRHRAARLKVLDQATIERGFTPSDDRLTPISLPESHSPVVRQYEYQGFAIPLNPDSSRNISVLSPIQDIQLAPLSANWINGDNGRRDSFSEDGRPGDSNEPNYGATSESRLDGSV